MVVGDEKDDRETCAARGGRRAGGQVVMAAVVGGCCAGVVVCCGVEQFGKEVVRYYVRKSWFPSYKGDTVVFPGCGGDMQRTPVLLVGADDHSSNVTYRLYKAVRHSCLVGALRRSGLHEAKTTSWNLMWSRRIKDEDYLTLNPYQKVNHFPGTWHIGRKDMLIRGIQRLKRKHGGCDIIPPTYLLPYDAPLLAGEMRDGCQPYIVKPPASSCGKGIYITTSFDEIPRTKEAHVVQKYITDPLIVDGYKCDLRLYAAVTSFDPLKIYIYEDGLVRFATERYSPNPRYFKDRLMHLTNYSVNKKSEKFKKNTNAADDGVGSKWSVRALKAYLAERGVQWGPIWADIKDVIIKAVISCEAVVASKVAMYVKHRNTCFELYGCDVLLTSSFTPYLLEINVMPALSCSSPLDRKIKSSVVTELLNLIGLQQYDRETYQEQEEYLKRRKLLGFESSLISRRDSMRSINNNSMLLSHKETKVVWEDLETCHLDIIRDSEDELRRRGGFERAFPTKDTGRCYSALFEKPRFSNTLLAEWEALKHGKTPPQKAQLYNWLKGAAPFPFGVRKCHPFPPPPGAISKDVLASRI